MNAGKMRDRVMIEAPGPVTDSASGEKDQRFDPVVERWAQVEELGGSEQTQALQIQVNASHRVTLRYVEGLSERHRIRWRGRFLGIKSVAADDKKRQQVCLCEQVK